MACNMYALRTYFALTSVAGSISTIEPDTQANHGLVILGDFNDLVIRTLTSSQNLNKQVANQPIKESSMSSTFEFTM